MRKLEIRNVEDVDREASGLVAAMARTLAAIAMLDGTLTTTEYRALVEAAGRLADRADDPSMPSTIALRALADPDGLDGALRRLGDAARGEEEETRRAFFDVALPLIRVSGDEARTTATRLAQALAIDVAVEYLDLPAPARRPRRAERRGPFGRLVSHGSSEDERLLVLLAIARAHGHTALARAVGEQLAEGRADLAALRTHCAELAPRIAEQAALVARDLEALAPRRTLAEILSQAIASNVRQIEQRLAAMIRRIDFQKEMFREDVRTFLDDPANGVEAVVRELMAQDDPLDRDIWDSFANTEHGRAVQLRYCDLQRRYEVHITLLREELLLFREELTSNRAAFLKTIDPNRSTLLAAPKTVPEAQTDGVFSRPFGRGAVQIRRDHWLHIGVGRILDLGDLFASGALILGALVLTGTGLFLLGGWLTPEGLIAEGLPYAAVTAGLALLGGLYKWLASPEKRRVRIMRRRRSRILAGLDAMMADTVTTHDSILDGVVEEFFATAEQFLAPLVHATQRTLDLAVLEERWIERSVRVTRESLRSLTAAE